MQAAAEEKRRDADPDPGGNAAVSDPGEAGWVLRIVPAGAGHGTAVGGDSGTPMVGPELHHRGAADHQISHLYRKGTGHHRAENQVLHPLHHPPAQPSEGVGGVQKDGEIPVDVPVPSERGRTHRTQLRTAEDAADLGEGWMQGGAVPRSAAHLRYHGSGTRHGCEDSVHHHRPCFLGDHAGHLLPRYRHHAEAGGSENRSPDRQNRCPNAGRGEEAAHQPEEFPTLPAQASQTRNWLCLPDQ